MASYYGDAAVGDTVIHADGRELRIMPDGTFEEYFSLPEKKAKKTASLDPVAAAMRDFTQQFNRRLGVVADQVVEHIGNLDKQIKTHKSQDGRVNKLLRQIKGLEKQIREVTETFAALATENAKLKDRLKKIDAPLPEQGWEPEEEEEDEWDEIERWEEHARNPKDAQEPTREIQEREDGGGEDKRREGNLLSKVREQARGFYQGRT